MRSKTWVEQQIREAWVDVARLEPDQWVPERWGDYGECFDAFANLKWEQVTRDIVMSNRSCVHFFNERALFYFLPAFMLASMEEEQGNQWEWDITQYTLLGITLLLESSRSEVIQWTPRQYMAVKQYLGFWGRQDLSVEARNEVLSCVKLLSSTLRQRRD